MHNVNVAAELPREHEPLYIDRKLIRKNRFNPRTTFDQLDLGELAMSVARFGVKDEIKVRPIEPDEEGHIYEVIDGDRRLLAAERAKIAKVPVIIKQMSDTDVLLEGIILNIYDRPLSSVEIGKALVTLKNSAEYDGLSLRQFSVKMGMTYGDVSQKMAQASKLPPEVQDLVAAEGKSRNIPEGSIDGRTAYLISHIPDRERKIEVGTTIARSNLRGEKARDAVRYATTHPKVAASDVVREFVSTTSEPILPTLTLSASDYEGIRTGERSTVIELTRRPGIREEGTVQPLIRADPLHISGVYPRTLGRFKEEDARREGFASLEEFKKEWIARYGEWRDDQEVVILQFYPPSSSGEDEEEGGSA